MSYRISVTLNSSFFFATEADHRLDALTLVSTFAEKFPKAEGYKIKLYELHAHSEDAEALALLCECYDNNLYHDEFAAKRFGYEDEKENAFYARGITSERIEEIKVYARKYRMNAEALGCETESKFLKLERRAGKLIEKKVKMVEGF